MEWKERKNFSDSQKYISISTTFSALIWKVLHKHTSTSVSKFDGAPIPCCSFASSEEKK